MFIINVEYLIAYNPIESPNCLAYRKCDPNLSVYTFYAFCIQDSVRQVKADGLTKTPNIMEELWVIISLSALGTAHWNES